MDLYIRPKLYQQYQRIVAAQAARTRSYTIKGARLTRCDPGEFLSRKSRGLWRFSAFGSRRARWRGGAGIAVLTFSRPTGARVDVGARSGAARTRSYTIKAHARGVDPGESSHEKSWILALSRPLVGEGQGGAEERVSPFAHFAHHKNARARGGLHSEHLCVPHMREGARLAV